MPYSRMYRFPSRRTYAPRRYAPRRYAPRKKKFAKYRRNQFPQRITSLTVNTPTVFPDKAFVKFKQVCQITLTQASGVASFSWPGNSFLNQATAGITSNPTFPVGLQNWARFYGKFRIFGSKIKMQASDISSANAGDYWGVFPMNKNTSYQGLDNPTEYLTNPYSKFIQLVSVPGRQQVITNFMKTKKILGHRIGTDSESEGTFIYDVGATNLANVTPPQEGFDWLIYYNDGTPSGTASITFLVTVTYYCQLIDRNRQLSTNIS